MSARYMDGSGRQGAVQSRLAAWLSTRGDRQAQSAKALRILLLVAALAASCVAYVAYFSHG